MNIIPMIFALILIFASIAYGIFRDNIYCTLEKYTYNNFSEARGKLIAERANTSFKIATKNIKDNEKSGVKKSDDDKNLADIVFVSLRDGKDLCNKLNIYTLVYGDKNSNEDLYDIAFRLINFLYKDTEIGAVKNFEKLILDTIINLYKERGGLVSFDDILSKLDGKNLFLYKVFKGTKKYEIGRSDSGYAPIGDYIAVCKSLRPINIRYISKPSLFVIFGDRVANKILDEEKFTWEKNHKDKFLNKKEFEELLSKLGGINCYEKIKNLVYVSKKKDFEVSDDIVVSDNKGEIILKDKYENK